jgi:monoamine oxidase
MRTRRAFVQGNKLGVETDVERTLSQAEQVFPGLSQLWNGKVTQSLPHKSRFFRASYAFYRVGQYTRFAGIEKIRQGNVLFCGEHTSLSFQGFMEGGASEGVRAARQLIRLIHGH